MQPYTESTHIFLEITRGISFCRWTISLVSCEQGTKSVPIFLYRTQKRQISVQFKIKLLVPFSVPFSRVLSHWEILNVPLSPIESHLKKKANWHLCSYNMFKWSMDIVKIDWCRLNHNLIRISLWFFDFKDFIWYFTYLKRLWLS